MKAKEQSTMGNQTATMVRCDLTLARMIGHFESEELRSFIYDALEEQINVRGISDPKAITVNDLWEAVGVAYERRCQLNKEVSTARAKRPLLAESPEPDSAIMQRSLEEIRSGQSRPMQDFVDELRRENHACGAGRN